MGSGLGCVSKSGFVVGRSLPRQPHDGARPSEAVFSIPRKPCSPSHCRRVLHREETQGEKGTRWEVGRLDSMGSLLNRVRVRVRVRFNDRVRVRVRVRVRGWALYHPLLNVSMEVCMQLTMCTLSVTISSLKLNLDRQSRLKLDPTALMAGLSITLIVIGTPVMTTPCRYPEL